MPEPKEPLVIHVKLFAAAKQAVGADRVTLELPTDPDLGQLRSALLEAHPSLEALLPHCRFAVNTAYANDSTRLSAGDDVACIPPVSGG